MLLIYTCGNKQLCTSRCLYKAMQRGISGADLQAFQKLATGVMISVTVQVDLTHALMRHAQLRSHPFQAELHGHHSLCSQPLQWLASLLGQTPTCQI